MDLPFFADKPDTTKQVKHVSERNWQNPKRCNNINLSQQSTQKRHKPVATVNVPLQNSQNSQVRLSPQPPSHRGNWHHQPFQQNSKINSSKTLAPSTPISSVQTAAPPTPISSNANKKHSTPQETTDCIKMHQETTDQTTRNKGPVAKQTETNRLLQKHVATEEANNSSTPTSQKRKQVSSAMPSPLRMP